jgi:acetyltransferase-like isoleucine patch superfamily enzyme
MFWFNNKHVNCMVGHGVEIPHPDLVNIYGGDKTILEDNVFVGPFVECQAGVKIGKNSRIQSHSLLCTGVEIGENVFIGHHVVFINDERPYVNNEKFIPEKTIVKNGASIGSNATILCGITIGAYSLIGAGSVVTKDVPDNAIVKGNPAK